MTGLSAGWLATFAVAMAGARWHTTDLRIMSGLIPVGVLAVALPWRDVDADPLGSEMASLWLLPLAVILPPPCAATAPLLHAAAVLTRRDQAPAFSRVFGVLAQGIAFGSTAVLFSALARNAHTAASWLLLVTFCGVVRSVMFRTLTRMATTLGTPRTAPAAGPGAAERLRSDLAELCAAILTAAGCAASPLAALLAVPLLVPLRRSLAHSRLRTDARIDGLTGLMNISAWRAAATAELARASRAGTPVSAAIIDIDRFKTINDTLGHLTGDDVIRCAAQTIRMHTRRYDLAGRYGGDEFLVLFPDTAADQAAAITGRISARIASCQVSAGHAQGADVTVTVSVGVTELAGSGAGLDDLIAAADAALYAAKRGGRNRVTIALPAARNY